MSCCCPWARRTMERTPRTRSSTGERGRGADCRAGLLRAETDPARGLGARPEPWVLGRKVETSAQTWGPVAEERRCTESWWEPAHPGGQDQGWSRWGAGLGLRTNQDRSIWGQQARAPGIRSRKECVGPELGRVTDPRSSRPGATTSRGPRCWPRTCTKSPS